MHICCEVMGVYQALVQKLVDTVDNHLEENYSQLLPHKLLEREDIVKNTTYHPQDPIATVFYAIKELLYFAKVSGTS